MWIVLIVGALAVTAGLVALAVVGAWLDGRYRRQNDEL